jgi:hypothetical protein
MEEVRVIPAAGFASSYVKRYKKHPERRPWQEPPDFDFYQKKLKRISRV